MAIRSERRMITNLRKLIVRMAELGCRVYTDLANKQVFVPLYLRSLDVPPIMAKVGLTTHTFVPRQLNFELTVNAPLLLTASPAPADTEGRRKIKRGRLPGSLVGRTSGMRLLRIRWALT